MKLSGIGALTGAGIGMVARVAVLALNFPQLVADAGLLLFPSALIGASLGAIAGALGRPLSGALTGAFLFGLVFGVLIRPIVVICLFFAALFSSGENNGSEILNTSWLLTLEMTLAGAIAGGVGGFAGWYSAGKPRDSSGREDTEESIQTSAPREPQHASYRQLAGTPCVACGERIKAQIDACFCSACGGVMHVICGKQEQGSPRFICSTCAPKPQRQ